MNQNKIIWTIGHSTRTADDFFSLLDENEIRILVDIRRNPGSKRYPHFNKETLSELCHNHGIDYHHFESLGGRRKPLADSPNMMWKNESFRGYADYMLTAEFKESVLPLESFAESKNTAYMCSEAVWWSCHRALLSDYLKKAGWKVLHIINKGKTDEHPFTTPERQKRLF